ncbi:MAG: peptidoglycan-binding protein [Clostridia bacterium]|nr:peptidoglycan-binding protein [Clostridia bacterium]
MNMKKSMVLILMLAALALILSACYVPEDNQGNQRPSQTVQAFQTIPPTASPTPTPTQIPPTTILPPQTTQGVQPGWTPSTPNPAAPETWAPETTLPVITNPIVQPVTPTPYVPPTQTPTKVLEEGTKDKDAVKRLQQRLQALGYYNGKIDGDFGAGTKAAVEAFQRANRLNVDGRVGEQTQKILDSTSAVRVTAAPRVTNTPRPTATPKTKDYMQIGSSGKNVTRLQERLISLGYLAGKTNGSYGGPTEYAVRAFQKRAGLYVDGKAGESTLTRLYASNAPGTSHLAATIGEAFYEGESGSGVRAMQQRLKELGYLKGSVDGSFGPATKDALTRFQAVNNLTSNGNATTATLNRLYAGTAIPASGQQVSSAGSGSAISIGGGASVVEQGMDSGEVKQIQTRLKELGFYTGKVDGVYGNETVTAVMAFQMSRGLNADGKVGSRTLAALNDFSYVANYQLLKRGSSGKSVTNLQYTLYELGYYSGSVDGKYGASTAAAVAAFQSRNGLNPTGEADNQTQTLLYSSNAKAAPASSGKYKTLRPGDVGEDVLEMKDVLIQLGYSTTNDNKYDEQTETAVRRFQERNGLKVDGIAGTSTLSVLYSDSPVPNN